MFEMCRSGLRSALVSAGHSPQSLPSSSAVERMILFTCVTSQIGKVQYKYSTR